MSWASLLLGLASLTTAASLQQVTTEFGPNPTNVGFYIYVPDTLVSKPAILVNPHWCHGTAQAAYAGSLYAATWANTHAWEGLTHDGGGDSLGIVSMVRWTIKKYNADASRVFVTGVSSGGMMTNLLVGAYPDVFAAGSAFAGVPFECYAYPGNNSGKAIVEAAYPGYNGWRPKFQTFYGPVDETVDYVNFGEQMKQWTSVLGLSEMPTKATANTPVNGWTKYDYRTERRFEAFSAAGHQHGRSDELGENHSYYHQDHVNHKGGRDDDGCGRWADFVGAVWR
ncbi:Alpha/Beta hydrolase protein [Neurospora tetraspora]|uniref:Alpha/Beta hydrolase protein n=1 Tax=Neurospora tetraspora TaxID=94610 RepID=A0AAE0MT07_9PEZI|nr:Alpha/Beta hydrolase protein [Neurospora tetraspora]